LTNQLEQKAIEYIEKIDAMGGMLKAIENGYPQREIQEAAFDYQRASKPNDPSSSASINFRLMKTKRVSSCA
jgi:methylmalonyl-CoA mutase N-terminal domain/subunit